MNRLSQSLWMRNKLKLFEGDAGAVLISAPEPYGASLLVGALDAGTSPLVWLELTEQDIGDLVAQGNRLVDAAKRGLRDVLLPVGLPFSDVLGLLKEHLSFLGPITLAVSNIQLAPRLREELISFAREGHVVILCDASGKAADDLRARVVTETDLSLSLEEALDLLDGLANEEAASAMLEASGTAIVRFSLLLEERFGGEAVVLPSPTGPRRPLHTAPLVDGSALIRRFASEGSYRDALELAAERYPEQVAEIIEAAGHYFHSRGMHQRLYALLKKLPEERLEHEFTLFWLLIAAFRQSEHFGIRKKVEAFLGVNEAPHLRAAYAGIFFTWSEACKIAGRAYETLPTPYTCFQYGRTLSDPDEAIQVHMQGLELAERYDRAYEKTRAAGELSNRLIDRGKYKDAIHWAAWGLAQYDRAGLSDYTRRLAIENNWAYAKILCGETGGLENMLRSREAHVRLAYPEIADRFKATLAELLLTKNRPAEALLVTRTYFEQAPRKLLAEYSLDHIRVLLELDEFDVALEVAEKARTLTIGSNEVKTYATLALGMVLSFTKSQQAIPLLETAVREFGKRLKVYRLTQASLYLAFAHSRLGDEDMMQQVLSRLGNVGEELSSAGLHLLGGPKRYFRHVYSLLQGNETPLDLKLLGEPYVWLEGQESKLTFRQLEILAVLVLRDQTVTLDELTALFGGSPEQKATLKAEVARLRKKVPISQGRYAVTVHLTADFVDIVNAIRQGKYPDAFKLYTGSLLPGSDVELIRETDYFIFEALRQVALTTGNPDYLLHLLDHAPDDLEIAEALLASLGPQDSRRQLAQARVINIRNSWGR